MTPEKNSQRKSKRTSAVNWKEGDTRGLLRAHGRRAPEEIAAARKKAAEEQKSKEQAMKAKAKKTARDIHRASELEDALAIEKVKDAFPRRLCGMFNRLFNAKRKNFTDVATRC
jgi:hypothetical protein